MPENYPYSTMSWSRWSGGDTYMDVPCLVSIDAGLISVSYEIDEIPYKYVGNELGEGHFVLTDSSVGGRATLHRMAASASATPDRPALVLEGSWIEDHASGMWRIVLCG